MSAYHENALRPGATLAEYAVESVLGFGGFSITYLARDTALGSFVAIKEYLPQEIARRDHEATYVIPLASKEATRHYHWGLKNFVKEARALAQFKHPNIVRVLRFIEANGTAYMVMEYERGQTLAQQLKDAQGRLDESGLLRIVMPILNGLQAVHQAGLLHLDIKPENIYLRRDGSPMLIDFGSARHAMTESRPSGRVTLTHGYAPIEQYPDKGTLGPWSDVYALGATMYRCVTGKRPDDSLQRYRAILDYKTDPLESATRAARGRYRPAILSCIEQATQIHAKDRPQSARELQDTLLGLRKPAAASRSSGEFAPGRDGGGRSVSPPRRGAARYAVTATLIVVLAAAGWLGRSEIAHRLAGVVGPFAAPEPAAKPITNKDHPAAASAPDLKVTTDR